MYEIKISYMQFVEVWYDYAIVWLHMKMMWLLQPGERPLYRCINLGVLAYGWSLKVLS